MEKTRKSQKKKRSDKFINTAVILLLIAGLCIMLYPTVSNWWNQRHETRAITQYIQKTKDMSAAERKQMWNEARAYNRRLAERELGSAAAGGTGLNLNLSPSEEKEYLGILDVTGTGIMGYVAIPDINVYLPIYHGTDEAALQVAIGHLEGTSFPVGGKSTHCVISGHTGLPSAKLFTDIDQLKKGNYFMLKVLGKTLTYKVDHIETVLPDQLDSLQIEAGKDYCTLVTCTPYGINTHRLLVRGHRVPNIPEEMEAADNGLLRQRLLLLLILLIALAAAGGYLWYRRRRQRRNGQTSAVGNEIAASATSTASEMSAQSTDGQVLFCV